MTQEQKELLLQDLCARLPYGVKINNEIQGDFEIYGVCENYIFARSATNHADFHIEKIKPYLLPLSSMTEEQKEIYNNFFILPRGLLTPQNSIELFTRLDKNHFDYRDLIPLGLAIDATELKIY